MRLCVLALLLWPVLYGQDVPVTTLKQTGLFALPSDPSRIARVSSAGGVLWFLLQNGNWSELLSTDMAGGNPTQFAIQPPAKRVAFPVSAICASRDGRIAVVRAEGTVEIYQPGGALLETVPLPHPVSNCVLDHGLWVWSKTGADFLTGGRVDLSIPQPQLPKFGYVDLLGLADHGVGLLESMKGVFYTLDQQAGNWIPHPLDAPEFQAIRKLPVQEDGTTVPFVMSPSVAGGEFYALANHTNRKIGARILRFDVQGNLKARYLCPLPTSVVPPTGMNPNGYLSPNIVVVMDRVMLLISQSQKVVASYSLE